MLQHQIADLGDGALLTASPQALQQWFDIPADWRGWTACGCLATPDANLAIAGLMRFRGQDSLVDWPKQGDLMPGAGAVPIVAQLQDPGRLPNPAESHPGALAWPLVQHQVDDQLAPQALMALPWSLWQHQQEVAWPTAADPALDNLDRRRRRPGWSARVGRDGKTLQVWTLVREGDGGLGAELAVAQARAIDRDWWGSSRPALGLRRIRCVAAAFAAVAMAES